MIRFGLRLAVASGREALVRLVTIVVAVALGVGLLLAALAATNAVKHQTARLAWQATGPGTPSQGKDPLWWLLRQDYVDGRTIDRVDLAATGANSPVPPGIPRLPGPGEYYASPALVALLRTVPADQLGDRFPGTDIGTIGPSALTAPNSLLIFVGRTPDEMAAQQRAKKVTGIARDNSGVAAVAMGMELILSVVAAGLLFPVLIFIGTATRLSATRREQRFAALRLVGATPGQISVLSAVDATAAALIGTALGFGVYLLSRGRLAAVPFTGLPFFPSDVALTPLEVVLVALGVPVGAALAAWLALRRVRISPLGVTRRVTPRPPRAYRLIPLVLGLAELAFFIGRRPETSMDQAAAFLSGILVVMAGLIIAGPWLTMIGSRALARRSGRATTLIAARRLADNPQAAFRAVSGVVLALFVTSVSVGVISTIMADRAVPHGGLAASVLADQFVDADGPVAVSDAVTGRLRAIPGVRRVVVLRTNPDEFGQPALVRCADLADAPELGACPAGATIAGVTTDLIPYAAPPGPTVWPAATVSADRYDLLAPRALVVETDGSRAAIERAQTVLEVTYPQVWIMPSTEDDWNADFADTLRGWQQLANVVILCSLPIAGCSLAVSVAGGLSDRKRPFSLLRLTGVPLAALRRVVALESAVPLLTAAVVAVGAGFLVAQIFLRAQMSYTLRPPGLSYYLIVLAGLGVSLAIIAATMPLLERITGPETARNE